MKTCPLGAETVPVAMTSDLIFGSFHDGRNYRIMLGGVTERKSSKPAFWPAKTTKKGRTWRN